MLVPGQQLFALAEVCHAYLLPHLSLLDMYHLSRTCAALHSLVSSAPEECLRTAALRALPPALVEHRQPVHRLWAMLQQQQRLMHHLGHLPETPMSHDYEWLPSSVDTSGSGLPMHHGRINPSRTSLLWPEWVGSNMGESTVVVLDLPSLDQRYRLLGPLYEASGARKQSAANWYEWSPNGSHIAILWGPSKPERGSGLGKLAASALHVYAAGTGTLLSSFQLELPNFEWLDSLMWHADGTVFHAQSMSNWHATDSAVYSIAGQVLSVLSVEPFNHSVPRNREYLALRPRAEALDTRAQIVYRMTGKSVALPIELQDELDQSSMLLDFRWSDNGMYASLMCDDRCRWFMCFDKGHLVWNKVHTVPQSLITKEAFSGDFEFSPHGRALAIEVPIARDAEEEAGRKLLHWHFPGDGGDVTVHIMDYSAPRQLSEFPVRRTVAWHPNPSMDVYAVSDGHQLGLYCAATNSCLSNWSVWQSFQHVVGSRLDMMAWASHGCELTLIFRIEGKLRLRFGSP